MKIISSITQLRTIVNQARRSGQSIGFVPTMGAFHDGHCSLMRRCRDENDMAIVSIFVNPAQFSPSEDYASYPRNKKRDVLLAKKENIDIIFYPSERTVYPKRFLTSVTVEEITGKLCGKTRPGHFRGVTTVVAKLLNMVRPDRMYLGQKDAQQTIVIKQMTEDLNFPVTVKVCPTVREKDGLAMSSRNKYLTEQQRREAVVLYKSILLAKRSVLAGQKNAGTVLAMMRRMILSQSRGKIDYVACVDARTLHPITKIRGKTMLALAVRFGKARLIDNVIFHAR